MKRFAALLMIFGLWQPVSALTFQGFSQFTTVAANCAPLLLHPKKTKQAVAAQVARLKKKKAKKT